jgi:PAS domain S-box-containing protein
MSRDRIERGFTDAPLDAAAASSSLLLALLQGHRTTKDPELMMQAAAAALGEHLAVDRVGFFEMVSDDTILFGVGWSAGRLPLLTGTIPAIGIGTTYLAEVRAGKTLGIADTRRDPLTADSLLTDIQTASLIGAPIMRGGRWKAGLYVNHAEPRAWTEKEVTLVRSVADQTWDAVERARAVAALVESNARLEAITNSIDQMIWSTGPDGFCDFYNRRWYDYTGVPVGSTDGEAWIGMFHPDDQDRAWSLWRHSLKTGEPYHIEYRLRHRTGVYRWVLCRAHPVRDDTGRTTRWYGTCTDIQDIVDAREVLALSREELEHAVEERTRERDRAWKFSQDLQAVLDSEGTFRAVNDAWTTILGWQPQEVVGRNHLEFNHPSFHPTSEQALQVAANRVLSPYETRCLHKDGSDRWISWVAAFEGGLVYASGRDVTAEKTAAAALEATRDQLRQSQKMEAMGQLTGGLAHDFNNLLGVISSSLDVLNIKVVPSGDTDVDRCVEIARRATLQAGSLTHRLLAFARQRPVEAVPTDINLLVADMETLICRSVGDSIKVAIRREAIPGTVVVDPSQLESALLNLCINARDAMPDGGELTIETAAELLDEAKAEESGLPAGPYVALHVADTGTGMPPDVAARVFDPFFTTKPVGEGTGLGLSMIYSFAEQSGGRVWVDSTVGRGTTMSILLPSQIGEAIDR